MACFIVPATEAIVTSIIEKKTKGKSDNIFIQKLGILNNMLWGGCALLAFEHIWHGEVTPWFPFLTNAANAADRAEMIMEMMSLIQMSCHKNLKSASPQFLCQSHADFMCHSGSTFPWSKRLISMKSHDPFIFPISLFDCCHFHAGGSRTTVDARNILFHNPCIFVIQTHSPATIIFISRLFLIDCISYYIR